MTSHSSDDWRPSCSAETMRSRAVLRRVIRDFFEQHGFLEVDTPLLSRDVIVDAHLDPIEVRSDDTPLFLQTSPEAFMKRLLASGCGSIFQITRSFRAGEEGRLHNPEFTLVEWYGTQTRWTEQLALTEDLVRCAAEHFPGAFTDSLLSTPFVGTTYQQAFQKYLHIDVLAATTEQLRRRCTASAGSTLNDIPQERDEVLNLLLAKHVEPHLGITRPEFLFDYAASQAALAQLSGDDPRVAHRFELYIGGLEICNGYQELTDPGELLEREQVQNRRRQQRGLEVLPGAGRLVKAMEHGLPECSGVALGFDRLLMVLCGADSLDDVLPFPLDRA